MHPQLLRGGEGGQTPNMPRGSQSLRPAPTGQCFQNRPIWGQYIDVSDMREQVTWKHVLKMKRWQRKELEPWKDIESGISWWVTEDPRLLYRYCGWASFKSGECISLHESSAFPLPYPVLGKKETPTLSSLSPVLELHGLCFKSLSTYECNNWYLLQQHFDTHLVTEFQKILVAFFFFEELIIKFWHEEKNIFFLFLR